MSEHDVADPFGYRLRADGAVLFTRGGRVVAVVAGAAARRFIDRAAGADAATLQRRMAQLTGSYRRGNERRAAAHDRNRGGRG